MLIEQFLSLRLTLNFFYHCFFSYSGTPALNMLNKLTKPTKPKVARHDIEDDENDIDMSAIRNPKLSSTRIEPPRRVPPAPVSVLPRTRPVESTTRSKPTAISMETTSNSERPHSDIIEKVLAGIPLSDNDIRKVIQRKK